MTLFFLKLGAGLGKIALAPFAGLCRGAVARNGWTWGLHAVLLMAVLVGLWQLNLWLDLDHVVHAPSAVLRQLWLPLLFVLAYSVVWVSLWTWRAINEPSAASPFPEIDQAWEHAVTAMQRRGVDLVEKPLMLVLGQPASHENDLLAALKIAPTFGPTPATPDATLRVVADDRAVYVLCHETSLLSACTERVVQERALRQSHLVAERVNTAAVEQAIPVALRVGAEEKVGAESPAALAQGDPDFLDTSFSHAEGEAASHASDTDDWGLEFESACETLDQRPLVSADRADEIGERLEHLLRLIRRDRDPVLPVNGVAVVFPCDAIESRRSSESFTEALRQDLDAIGDAGVRCPVAAIGADLHHLEGAGHLLHSLSAERKSRHYGVNLPGDAMASESSLREAVEWLTGEATPALCERLYQFDADGAAELADNTALFRFQSEVARRGELLSDLLAEGLAGDDEREAWPCVGAYLVATGDALGGSQAFGAGVLDTLLDQHLSAGWTADAIQRDATQGRVLIAGYASLAAAVLLVLGVVVL